MSLYKKGSCLKIISTYIASMLKILKTIVIFFMLSTNTYSAGGGAQPDGGSEGNASKYEKGHKLVLSAKYLEKKADKFLKKGKTKKAEKSLAKAKSKYEKAFKLFMQSNKEKPNNPDTLNYLGFSSRKLGNFVEAEKYYLSGLSLKPNHKRINQYLGELYLNTNRKDKAIEQLEILKSCSCKEYDQLSNLIEGKTVSKY